MNTDNHKLFDFDKAIADAEKGIGGPWREENTNPHGFLNGHEFHASLLRRLKGFIRLFNNGAEYPKHAAVLNYPRTVFHSHKELLHRIMELCEILNLQELVLRVEKQSDGSSIDYSLFAFRKDE